MSSHSDSCGDQQQFNISQSALPSQVPQAPIGSATPHDLNMNNNVSVYHQASLNAQHQRKKKSRIIPPDKRKKVAQACDSCKKRKQKCNGLLPCDLCSIKQFSCEYTAIDRRVLKMSRKTTNEPMGQQIGYNHHPLPLRERPLTTPTPQPQASYNGAPNLYSQMAHTIPAVQQHTSESNTQGAYQQEHYLTSSQPQPIRMSANEPSYLQHHTALTNSQKAPDFSKSPKTQIPNSLQPLLSFPVKLHSNDFKDDYYNDTISSLGENPNLRVLFDQDGNVRYIGESAPSAYLLQCRKIFQKTLGNQKFSQDQENFIFVDTPSPIIRQKDKREQIHLPVRQYADYLVKTYLNNLNNILYILDDDTLLNLVDNIYVGNNVTLQKEHCLLYLVLAIGSIFAQFELSKKIFPFPQDYFVDPHGLFENAISILNGVPDDGHIWLVEAHLLIFFYYQFKGHKHTAWSKLGNAIRTAQGLGLNRRFVNESFKDPCHVLHRRKLFRSLYITDTVTSFHLGRSVTLRAQEWDDIDWFENIDDYQNKLLKVCYLNGRILTDIFHNPQVTLKNAIKLAVELKIYSLKNPIIPLKSENYSASVDHKYLLPHVIYLNGIILLSRPFFHFIVLQKLGLIKYDKSSSNFIHLNNFYQSCIKASLLIVKVVEYSYNQNIHPFKPMNLTACLFHAGLILGLLLLMKSRGIDHEMFKSEDSIDVDPEAMLTQAMKTVIDVLNHYGNIDTQAQRYSTILQNMIDSLAEEDRTLDLSKLFEQNGSDTFSSKREVNTQAKFENILRFQDWFFPKVETQNTTSESNIISPDGASEKPSKSPESSNTDDFSKDIAGLNNINFASGPHFLDDFLYTMIDSNN